MATYNFNVPNARLNPNEIYAAIYNMIINLQVFGDNIKGVNGSLVEKFRTEGSAYGDTRLFYATDALKTQPWLNDLEAQNLLKLHRPASPKVQAVTISEFRFIPLTTDNYLTKRAWGDEYAFSSFNSIMTQWMRDTKRIYDATLINTFVGTTESNSARAVVELPVASAITGLSGEEKNRVSAQTIAQGLADLMVDLKDISRDFNDYGFLRSYDESDLLVIWNSKYVNKITKVDLPTIFHKDSIFTNFTNVLPARYFGHTKTSATAAAANDGTFRTLVEADYATAANQPVTHIFPGDLIPSGTSKVTELNENGTAKVLAAGIPANNAYEVADDIICKIIHKDSVPFMSAFETSTAFFNPRSLTDTKFIIWGYSEPCYLLDKPFLTIEED